jgi:hypothetical protein
MSSGGRTKGARSQQKIGFDNTKVMIGGQEKETDNKELSEMSLRMLKRNVNVEEIYEIPTTIPQRTLILERLEEVLLDLLPARSWEYKKWWCFVWCTVSALFGAFGCLWAMGETVLFADQRPSMARLGGVCVLFIPFFIWFKVVFFPHGNYRIHLNEMTEKRRRRRWEEKQRGLHLEGSLPRPVKEIEIPDAPYEYQPDEPWMYVRWKPKPKIYYYIDDNNVCHKAIHGSKEEAKEITKEKEINKMLQNQTFRQGIANAAMAAMSGGDGEGEEKNLYDEIEEGRMSSTADDNGRMSSSATDI